ncbi:NF-kappa-B essential modulator-like [Mercenaria mercenaria]|uniref:NF-kappa-B essential modulator-like n=1 Tax=Mercenaria mercenaria TaxID=6596 RepID=UPI00234E5526|nr:NF-kappa-B essential modulator-like [Mercenaria mercenaria]XP_045190569.2 NF-kappa-B essential modulator-like [Mercenaria mercenaria]XP_045190570.2 NF-kappa-B essential modulator-like [Mercenaria mercenaria]XP_045190571.2 NF-kappa-B essential modulator-like [Mercenaria mercenaria]
MSDIPPRQSPVPTHQRSYPSSSGSSMNVEVERDHYKEKVEHFKFLVRKLQEENQTYKLRKESTETVSRLLQESKQEVAALQKKCSLFDAIIRTLQSRLESNGLSSDVCPREGEEYIPGQSKNLLDNLTRENKRLRSIIRSRSGDPEEYAKLQQLHEESERVCSELRIQCSNQQTRIAELEQVLRSSDNEKDRTINELREKINHMTRELTSRDTLCTTLAEETRMLQKQLEDVARQCQELAKRLTEQGHNTDKIVQTALKAGTKDGTEASKTIIEENKSLKQKVREITEMNKRWQDYNNQREAYVKTLLTDLNGLQKRIEELSGNAIPHETQVEMNRILDEARRLTRELDEQKRVTARTNNERDRFKRELENANGVIITLRNENHELKRLAESGSSHESSETINALKAQIRICTEDFESERKDRERAVSKASRLEHELERLRKENENLKREVSRFQASPQIQSPYTDPFYHYPSPGAPHGNFSNERLAARGVSRLPQEAVQQINIDRYNVIDGSDLHADGENHVLKNGRLQDNEQTLVVAASKKSDDDYNSLNASSISSKERCSPSPRHSPRSSRDNSPINSGLQQNLTTKTGDVLRCPKCNKEFTSDEHPELLEHMDSCAY